MFEPLQSYLKGFTMSEQAQAPAATPTAASPDLSAFFTVQVAFSSGAIDYTYKVSPSLALSPLDQVVVEVGAKGCTVGRVVSVSPGKSRIDPAAKFIYKWIVCKVDRGVYDQILAAEAAARGGQ